MYELIRNKAGNVIQYRFSWGWNAKMPPRGKGTKAALHTKSKFGDEILITDTFWAQINFHPPVKPGEDDRERIFQCKWKMEGLINSHPVLKHKWRKQDEQRRKNAPEWPFKIPSMTLTLTHHPKTGKPIVYSTDNPPPHIKNKRRRK